MKAKIFYLLILGSLFLHPQFTFVSMAKQGSSFNHSLKKVLEKNPAVIYDSENSNAFFAPDIGIDNDISADVDVDDDDDVSFSTRKKISFERAAIFYNTQYICKHFDDTSFSKYCSSYSYHLSPSHFISIRVFRL